MRVRAVTAVLVAAGVLVTGVWSATAVGSPTDGRGAFTDDDGSVHESDINALAAADITLGCNPPANTDYCPHDPVTRAQMASFLTRANQLPPSDTDAFTDDDGSVHESDINALAAADITLGCNPPANTDYCPHDPVTRAQMASFLTRANQLPPSDTDAFTDDDGSVHESDINALAAADITLGCNPPANTDYCPHDPVTRAQMASFLTRAEGLEPIPNTFSMIPGTTCTKDGTSCSGRTTLAEGTRLRFTEGFYQILPYRSGEKEALTGSGTSVTFTWNGAPVDAASLGVVTQDDTARRRWRFEPAALTDGTHVVAAAWRWQGQLERRVTWVITVP